MKPTLKTRARRARSNAWFKHKSTFKWKQTGATPPSQAHLRWWELKKVRRQNFAKEAPEHLAYAVMQPLIRRYRENHQLDVFDDEYPQSDIFEFWCSWLSQISLRAFPEAAGYRSSRGTRGWLADKELCQPIQDLRDAISDLRSGVRSKYTEAFFIKKRKGDRSDPKEIADHKQKIGLTCKLLTEIGYLTQPAAVQRINMALRKADMRYGYTLDSIKKWARSVTQSEFEFHARIYISVLMTSDDNIIINWNDLSHERCQQLHAICSDTPFDELIDIWRDIVESVKLSLPERPSLERYKLLRLWATHLRVHQGMWIATSRHKESLERFGI